MHRGVCRRGGRQRQPDRVSARIASFDFGLPGGTPQAGHHRARDRYRRSAPRADHRDRRARRAGQPALQRGRDQGRRRLRHRAHRAGPGSERVRAAAGDQLRRRARAPEERGIAAGGHARLRLEPERLVHRAPLRQEPDRKRRRADDQRRVCAWTASRWC